ncbi:MAG TPA: hypothetical protein VGN63_12775 [Flavisolibacter sp.]|jgi:hypothetical protein|nr:hypothetical protein [Flavisolibacter sp.]
MKSLLFSLLFLPLPGWSQVTKEAVFYCIDHAGKTLHYSTGKAVVKKDLHDREFYQYGFLKWKGWINKSWQTLAYDFRFLPAPSGKKSTAIDSLISRYRTNGYTIERVPMPYPMKPFAGYKKDGTN